MTWAFGVADEQDDRDDQSGSADEDRHPSARYQVKCRFRGLDFKVSGLECFVVAAGRSSNGR